MCPLGGDDKEPKFPVANNSDCRDDKKEEEERELEKDLGPEW